MSGLNKVEQKDLSAIRALFAEPARVLSGGEISGDYAHDELGGARHMPDIVCVPKTCAEVSALMRYADARRLPVTPRGAGTGLVGAAVPVVGGILLDMSHMNRILELDEDNLTLTVEPGALLMEIAAYVESRGLFYPPDPGEKTATIAGNISTNAGGMRAVKYGVTRDYVAALQVVLPGGDVISLGGKTVKNSSGLALKELIVGAEGTLGVITQATLKLLPLPECAVSLLVPFRTLEQAIGTVPAIVRSRAMPTAIEYMERDVILDAEEYLGKVFPDHSADAYLLLRFDGQTPEQLRQAYESVAELCLEHGALDVLISDTEERDESIWPARGAFLEAIKASTTDMDEVDCVVPRGCVHDMARFAFELQAEAGLRIKSFGHAGDGNLHMYLLRDDLDDAQWRARMGRAMDSIYKKAAALGGRVSGEHGIGYAKKKYLLDDLEPGQLALMRGIKRVFDPHGILNPHKVFEE